jgi:membrane protein
VFGRAASLSYYFMFALFPLLLVLMTLLGMLQLDLMEPLMDTLGNFMPSDVVRTTADELAGNTSGRVLSFGIITALWSASSGMSAMMSAVNRGFDLEDRRPWHERKLIAVGLTVILATMIPAGLLLLLFGDELEKLVGVTAGAGPWIATAWSVTRWIVTVALLDVGINLLYYLSLAKRPKWRWLTPGSTFAVGAWIAMSLLLQLALMSFMRLGATYGSIAGVMALLLWLYYTGVLILVGAEIDSEIGRDWTAIEAAITPAATLPPQ